MSEPGRIIPVDATVGRRTPTFTSSTVPAGLLGVHHTTGWAELIVLTGKVKFVEHSPERTMTAEPGRSVVILPGKRHHVEPATDAEFYVQFYDQTPEAGSYTDQQS